MSTSAITPAADDTADRMLPLTGLRGAIARSMGQGWQIPRVAHSIDVDVSRFKAMREALAGEGHRPSLTVLLLRAVALTLREHPRLNALMRDKAAELMPDINLGVAVSLDDGLMVPVIREADTLSLPALTSELRRLAEGARAGTLSAGSYQRATFTVSNLGMTAIDRFSPIINPPQVAILGVTRVLDRPVVRDGEIVSAPMMGLHLVFDHRVVDGYPAALFLGDLARRIETAAL
ncbi:dihydrolipoamide acetyltransferase family protein [Denitromonas halophila]|uniref:2-oxo acid dehydrogenase subunit E2 n=1 Tax=Denitromonas halophila TaxID=1629404 RepID=A0A557QWB1_9RHOO|nr:dihydrolipoamide acetyltransferase family protein [Denitromonas halophila]TVO57202.1 2-oxo acid dehydrogenase subunit E2 [Denitromonas halophila]